MSSEASAVLEDEADAPALRAGIAALRAGQKRRSITDSEIYHLLPIVAIELNKNIKHRILPIK